MIEKELLKKQWHREMPEFLCPFCKKSVLLKKSEKTEATRESENFYDAAVEPECLKGYFSAIFECKNPKCEEKVMVAGNYRVIEMPFIDRDGFDEIAFELHDHHQKYSNEYQVTHINPPIEFINIPEKTPKNLAEKIRISFALFWIDASSCANAIRASIEILLDSLKVSRTTTKDRKRSYLQLHDRIVKLRKSDSVNANHIEAIKWIGNEGSHARKKISTDDILSAYEILVMSRKLCPRLE